MSEKATIKEDKEPELTMEDRLKALLYQFVTLYDRWREDRQIAAKRDAEIAELAESFKKEIENFRGIEEKIRFDLGKYLERQFAKITKETTAEINDNSAKLLEKAANKLDTAVDTANQQLSHYQQEVRESSNLKFGATVIGLFAGAIGTAVLLARFMMPAPALPLTDLQIDYLKLGRVLTLAKTQMNAKEFDHVFKLANRAIEEQKSKNNAE